MAITIPSIFKLTSLKQICLKCGISTSGTKAILQQRLQDEVPSLSFPSSQPTKPLRILSIDMGIRNLAFCLLEVPPLDSNKKSLRPKLPILQSWQKLSLIPQNGDTEVKAKNEFSPAILSEAAYKVLRDNMIPLSPTLVLIERQRFRSMGSKHILEWTIRVNMLESMLWAILKTLRAEGIWDGEVKEVTPGKVGAFWIVGEEGRAEEGKATGKAKTVEVEAEQFKKVRNTKDAKSKNKGAKIDLVRKWLEEEDAVTLGSEEVKQVRERYVEKWDRKRGNVRGRKVRLDGNSKSEEMGKLDDLADCLLQGMAWIKWEENRRQVLEKGVEVLIES